MHCFKSPYVSLFALSLIISSCTWVNPNQKNTGMCRALNSDIIFNGATSDTRQVEIDSAAKPLQQHMYDTHCQE